MCQCDNEERDLEEIHGDFDKSIWDRPMVDPRDLAIMMDLIAQNDQEEPLYV